MDSSYFISKRQSIFIYHIVTPPSTRISCPVMYELASLARKTHAPRISSGSATRPFMISSFQLSRSSGNYDPISSFLGIHLILI